ALEKPVPVPINLRLVFRVYDERYRVVERFLLTGGHGRERLTAQNEFDHLHRSRRAARRFTRQRRDAGHARVRKDGGVKRGGLFGLLGIPDKGRNFRHQLSPLKKQRPQEAAARLIMPKQHCSEDNASSNLYVGQRLHRLWVE